MNERGLSYCHFVLRVGQVNPVPNHRQFIHDGSDGSSLTPSMNVGRPSSAQRMERYVTGTAQRSNSRGPPQRGSLEPETPCGHYSSASNVGYTGKGLACKGSASSKPWPTTPDPPSPLKSLSPSSVAKRSGALRCESWSPSKPRNVGATGTTGGSFFSANVPSSVGPTPRRRGLAYKGSPSSKPWPATPEPPSPLRPPSLLSISKRSSALHSRSPPFSKLRSMGVTGTNSGSFTSNNVPSSVRSTSSRQGAAESAGKTGGPCPSSQTTSAVRKIITPPLARKMKRKPWITSVKLSINSSEEESDDEGQPQDRCNTPGKTTCKWRTAGEASQRPAVKLPINRLKQRSVLRMRRGTSITEKPVTKKPAHKLGPSKRQEMSSAVEKFTRPSKEQLEQGKGDDLDGYKENLMMLTKGPITTEDKSPVIQVNKATYQMLKLIGKGGSSKVYMVLSENKELRAVKLVSLEGVEPEATQAFLNEVRILKTLRDCSRVVTLYDFEYDQERSLLMLVMEAGDNDLASVIRSATEKEPMNLLAIKFYWSEMLQAVLEIHNKGVIHSDLKPANFLQVKGRLKLIDFGIADLVQADATSIVKESQMGTLNFMSPESIARMPGNGTGDCGLKISRRSDIWSLGCILYTLAYGRAPFQHIVARNDKLRAIINPNFAIPFPPVADPNLLDVLKRCLRRNPRERPTISELLQHPFLTEDRALLKPQRNDKLQTMFSEIENMSPDSVKKVNEMVKSLKLGKK
ncbi:probable serine/threonine-protein kinase mps1 isoform X1 [Ixodes scapularis]|uniref:probable serine/threonine-protein kinase mps1 isoform X1 n=3 Tax=Ixodes scapularis TaxID=6945 RepID=UPI001AD77129|nr:probable serine/threonine-protein kinase mps1 isoform X1 [Ixodes scapularis]XP_040356489.1 probable serine/threonine-protein kinase mps1 isoform X1 [Ixodes scapularis]